MTMHLFIAGRMRGVPHFNFPAFFKAQEELRFLGYTVYNPAAQDVLDGLDPYLCPKGTVAELHAQNFSLSDSVHSNLAALTTRCDGVVTFDPVWTYSAGAVSEVAVAQMLGLGIYELHEGKLYERNPTLRVASRGKRGRVL
jgi:hypothetical protein